MIAKENLSTLLPASEVIQHAKSAVFEHELGAVARAINTNANTGETATVWNGPLSDEVKEKLEANNYIVKPHKDAYSRDIPNMYTIVAGGK